MESTHGFPIWNCVKCPKRKGDGGEKTERSSVICGCCSNWASEALLERLLALEMDGLIAMHAHTQTRGRAAHTHAEGEGQAFICCFLRQIRLSCAKQRRWWPSLKSWKKVSLRAVFIRPQGGISMRLLMLFYGCFSWGGGGFCAVSQTVFAHNSLDIKGPRGKDWLQKGCIIPRRSYLPPLSTPQSCAGISQMWKLPKRDWLQFFFAFFFFFFRNASK